MEGSISQSKKSDDWIFESRFASVCPLPKGAQKSEWFSLPCRTGYLKHVAKYDTPFQNAAAIRPGQEGADNANMENKVVVITG